MRRGPWQSSSVPRVRSPRRECCPATSRARGRRHSYRDAAGKARRVAWRGANAGQRSSVARTLERGTTPRFFAPEPPAEYPLGSEVVEVEAPLDPGVVLDPRGAGTDRFRPFPLGKSERVGVGATRVAEHDAGRRVNQGGRAVEDHSTIHGKPGRELVP